MFLMPCPSKRRRKSREEQFSLQTQGNASEKVEIKIQLDGNEGGKDSQPESSIIQGSVQIQVQNTKPTSHCEFKSLSLYVEGALDPEQEESLKYWTVLSQIGLLIPKLDMMDFYVSSFLISPEDPRRCRRIPLGHYSFPFQIQMDPVEHFGPDTYGWTPLTLIVRGKLKNKKRFCRRDQMVETRKVLFIKSCWRPSQIILTNQPLFLAMKRRIFPNMVLVKVDLIVPERCRGVGETMTFELNVMTNQRERLITEISVALIQKIVGRDKCRRDNLREITKTVWNLNDEGSQSCSRIHWLGEFVVPEMSGSGPPLLGKDGNEGIEIVHLIKFVVDLDGKHELQGEAMIEVEENRERNLL